MNIATAIEKLAGTTLKTLDRGNPFDVVKVEPQKKVWLFLHKTGKERPVPWGEIEAAWGELQRRGEISRVDIRDRHSDRNPAYVAALLAALDGVEYKTRPIRLRLVD